MRAAPPEILRHEKYNRTCSREELQETTDAMPSRWEKAMVLTRQRCCAIPGAAKNDSAAKNWERKNIKPKALSSARLAFNHSTVFFSLEIEFRLDADGVQRVVGRFERRALAHGLCRSRKGVEHFRR
jgi:hypothetical protein